MTSEEEDVLDSRRETATLDGSASASRIEHLPYITQGRMALTLSFRADPMHASLSRDFKVISKKVLYIPITQGMVNIEANSGRPTTVSISSSSSKTSVIFKVSLAWRRSKCGYRNF